MLQAQRHQQILAKLHTDGQVTVKDLSQCFGVTEDCIRKDLTLLEKEKKLKRVHGGATQVRQNPHVFHVEERKTIRLKEKKKIAKKAVSMIEKGSMIFLDISTITLEMAKLIYQNNMDITLVTNMIDIMELFRQESSTRVIFIGGDYNNAKDGFAGMLTIQQLKNYHFDIAFMGVVGVDLLQNKVTTYEVDDGLTKEQVIISSKKCYIVCESEKLSSDGNYVFARVSDFTGMILEEELKEHDYQKVLEYGLEVL